MPRHLVQRGAAALVLAGLAFGGYSIWVPVHRPDPRRLAAVASTAPVAGLRGHPKTDVVDPATSSSLEAVKSAAASTPGETAAYAVDWEGKAPVTAASLELTVLPTLRSARTAQAEAVAAELSSTSLTQRGYGFGGKTDVLGIPGARGAYYLGGTSPTVTSSTRRAAVVVFRTGRVVLDVTVDAKGAVATPTVRSLALAQYRHLARIGADPRLAETLLPLVATVLYVVVAIAVGVMAEVAPGVVAATQRRRHEAHEAAARQARAGRGRKVVRRQASRSYAGRAQARAHRR